MTTDEGMNTSYTGERESDVALINGRPAVEDVDCPPSVTGIVVVAGADDSVVDRLPRRSFAQRHSIPILAHLRQHRPAITSAPSSLAFLHGPPPLDDDAVVEDKGGSVRGTQRTLRLRHATQACEARTALGRMYALGMSAGSVSRFALSSPTGVFFAEGALLIVVAVNRRGREGREVSDLLLSVPETDDASEAERADCRCVSAVMAASRSCSSVSPADESCSRLTSELTISYPR